MKKLMNLLTPYKGMPKEVYIIFVSRIVNAVGCFVMPLLTLILTDKIGLSKDVAGMYISIAGLLYIPTSMLGGKLTDMVGRKGIIIIFNTLAAVLYIYCGFMTPSPQMAYVIMAAGGLMNIAGPAYDSLIADITTPENRDGAYALLYMGWNIGFAVGPVLGGFLYKNYLPMVFIGDAATALLSLCLILFFVKESIGKTREVIEDSSRELEKREEGSIFGVLAKRPILIYFALISFGYNFVYSQWSFMMPMHAGENFGDAGAKYYGLMAGFNGVVVMFFTPLVTKILENKNNIRKMVYGGVLYAFGFGILGIVNTLPVFFLSVFIFTLGEIVLSISVTPFVVNHTPASHRGRMSSVIFTILGFGFTMGPLVMGRALSYIRIETGWIALGILAFAASYLMHWLEKYDAGRGKEYAEGEAI